MSNLLVRILFATSASLIAVPPMIALADAPATAPAPDLVWSRLIVQSIKPTLAARNVFVLRGVHQNGVSGGWSLTTSYAFDAQTKAVRITIAASAPKGARFTRDLPTFEARVEIAELAGPAYSGVPGSYDVIVVDHDGKELARTSYTVKPKA